MLMQLYGPFNNATYPATRTQTGTLTRRIRRGLGLGGASYYSAT